MNSTVVTRNFVTGLVPLFHGTLKRCRLLGNGLSRGRWVPVNSGALGADVANVNKKRNEKFLFDSFEKAAVFCFALLNAPGPVCLRLSGSSVFCFVFSLNRLCFFQCDIEIDSLRSHRATRCRRVTCHHLHCRLQFLRDGRGLLRTEQHHHAVGHRVRALRRDHVDQLPPGGGQVAHHPSPGPEGTCYSFNQIDTFVTRSLHGDGSVNEMRALD